MNSFSSKLSDHAFALSLLFIMAVYLPVNYFGFINFDDVDVVARIHNRFNDIPWYRLFFRSSAPQYYRPLLELLCYLDYALWGLSIQAWHLTNYILHILNSCLVYLIALNLLRSGPNPRLFASLAMLLFALNPMTCESVAWISGRSDLAGTFFALIAMWGYFLKSKLRIFIVPVAILAGLLCKENALALIPLIVIFEAVRNFQENSNFKQAVKRCLFWVVIMFIPLMIYLYLRSGGFENFVYQPTKAAISSTGNVAAVGGKSSGSLYGVAEVLYLFPVIAFYLKKLVIPFPLNFAIERINTVYYSMLFFIISGINLICVFKKQWVLPVFTILLITSFSPSLLVALDKVAWVPLAERYLYLSLAVMGTGAAFFFRYIHKNRCIPESGIAMICVLIIAVLSISTFQRQFAFKDDKSIWAATLKANPDSSMVLCMYGQTVKGVAKKASYQKAVTNPKPFKWRAKALIILASLEMTDQNYGAGQKYIENALALEPKYEHFLNAAIIYAHAKNYDPSVTSRFKRKAVYYYKKAYSKKKDAFVLYKAAQLLFHLGEADEARKMYERIKKHHPSSKYAVYAKKHLAK